jgi:serine/threonine-protein kinase
MESLIRDIPAYPSFAKIEPIDKGWSGDKKYRIETRSGERLLLRVADIAERGRKRAEFDMLGRVAELGVPAPRPVCFGECGGGKRVYQLLTWIDGEDAEAVLPALGEAERYALGAKAGDLLRKIHSVPAPGDAEDWSAKFGRKVQGRMDFYDANPIKSENGDVIAQFLTDNRTVLNNRPQTFNHGDFNKSNLICMPDGDAGIVDFNAYNGCYGDPYWEFAPDNWGDDADAFYRTGLINGYFDGEAPAKFFLMLRYYLAYDALAALCDTSIGEQGVPEDGKKHLDNVCRWYDDMRAAEPPWYLKGCKP